MRLNFFAKPLPNESMYSIASRYKRLVHLRNTQFVLRSLFDHQGIVIHTDLPSHLSILSERLDSALSVNELIQSHTAFRYFGHFQTPPRRDSLYAAMAGSPPPSPMNAIGAMSAVIKAPKYLMFCPECIRCDRDHFNVAYWHLNHQRPGVVICAEHAAPLWRSSVERRLARSRHALMDLETAVSLASSELVIPERQFPLLLGLSQSTRQLFKSPLSNDVHFDSVRANLKKILCDRGYLTKAGNVRSRGLVDLWNAKIDSELHQLLDCNLSQVDISQYVHFMRRSSSTAANPLPSLIAAELLGASAFDLLETAPLTNTLVSAITSSIGRLYTCRNTMCEGMGKQETELSGSVSTKHISRYCGLCHAVYRHRPNESEFCWLDRGIPFRKNLHQMVTSGELKLNQISTLLGVDRDTIKRSVALLGLQAPWKPIKELPPVIVGPCRSDYDRRVNWLELMRKNPFLSVAEISKLDPSLATALKRYDREWFDLHQPAIPKRRPRGPRRKSPDFDRQLSLKLISCITTILQEPKAIKITQAELERRLNYQGLFSKANQQHFPETLAAATSALDSPETFSNRRIDRAVEHFVNVKFLPDISQFARFLNLRERSIAPWKEQINLALQQIDNQLAAARKGVAR